jgi:GTPase SAR1 family protein
MLRDLQTISALLQIKVLDIPVALLFLKKIIVHIRFFVIDILYTRYATTKISETMFNIGGAKYQVIDVGGQTKYRAAWPRFFDNSDAILFIVSLASYDQTMEEDGHRTVNRMADSLSLFDKISNHELLQKIAIILLMNKSDLAEQKVTRSSLSKYFSDYTGK